MILGTRCGTMGSHLKLKKENEKISTQTKCAVALSDNHSILISVSLRPSKQLYGFDGTDVMPRSSAHS